MSMSMTIHQLMGITPTIMSRLSRAAPRTALAMSRCATATRTIRTHTTGTNIDC